MDSGTITLDRESFKALASEVRVEILKQLEDHRMTVTDLSNAMNLAKPTLLEHLERLVSAGLVTKKDEGRKWIYYELTKRGRYVLNPHQVKILISLAVSGLLFAAGIFAVLAAATTTYTSGAPFLGYPDDPRTGALTEADRNLGDAVAVGAPGPWGFIFIALAFVPLLVALWYRRASRRVIDEIRGQLATP